MGNFLKKNWFVAVIACLLICISVYTIYDQNKGKLKGKTANGEDVVYTIGDQDITVSDFYNELYDANGTSAAITMMRNAIAEQSVETTAEMKETAAAQAASIISNYRTNYSTDYMNKLNADLAATGYTDLEDYLITSMKEDQVIADYAKAHFDELNIRRISYILLNFTEDEAETAEETTTPADTEETAPAETTETEPAETSETTEETTAASHPTKAEQDKMDAVDEFLKTGTFAEAAKEFSDDSSTAPEGGVLGLIDTNTSNLDSAFYEAAMALKEGETSAWILSDQFGWFLIRCDAATPESIAELYIDSNPYTELADNYDTELFSTAIWDKANKLGLNFNGNEELEKAVKKSFAGEEEE